MQSEPTCLPCEGKYYCDEAIRESHRAADLEQKLQRQQAVIEEMGRALAASSIQHVPPRATCNCCWCRCDRQADILERAQATLLEAQELQQKDRDEIELLKKQLWDAKAALLELEAENVS